MIFWYLLISAASPIYTKDSQFECGNHGRFEYCIDGIPGCIIGCHCHPGYYFDTDTKICEPNSKLSQSYRRQYSGEPTRIYHGNSFEMLETTTLFSTANYLDDHVDAIAQNTDDLGDWLYNQFFKTIEKQVINKTDTKVMSRRSGKGPTVKATKKKFKKVKKGTSKRKQKEDLRRKLLRITEDDSLFNSDADTDTDTDTDDDSSHSSSSDETHENNDREHGHKKFVIVNKKPKPPLPSFIFLPNIETPFYPPVGLPPPVLPMYPMVPVPPVLPSPYMPNMLPDCDPIENTTNGTTTSSFASKATSVSSLSTELVISTTETLVTTTANSETSPPSTNIESTTTVSRKRLRKKKRMRDKNEILRRLQELVQQKETKSDPENITKIPGIIPLNNMEKDSIDVVEEFPIKPNNDNELEFRANYKAHAVQEENAPNFKYLSELIHHLNESKKSVVTVQPSFQRLKALLDLQRNKRIMNARSKIVEPTRRFNYNVHTEGPNPETEFYTNLGKQIATLIRGVDTKYERQINIEIEHNKNIPNHPMYNELNYLPNSYWERFARSPVNDIRRDEDKMKYFNKGNEALYRLENIVEMAASTRSPMSLVELENVVNVIEKPLQDMQKTFGSSKVKNSHNTLNINLWPQLPLTNPLLNVIKPSIEYIKQHLNYTDDETTESDANSDVKSTPAQNNSYIQRIKNNIDSSSSINIQNYTIGRRSNETRTKKFFPQEDMPYFNIKPPEKPDLIMDFPVRQSPPQMPKRRSNTQYASMSPLFDYNPKMNFYNVNRQYPIFNTVPKHALPLFEKSSNKHQLLATPRSYFHRELHPFDYIE